MSKKSFQVAVSLVSGLFILVFFMNCAPVHESYESGLASTSNDFPCSGPYEEAFGKTIHELALNSCTLCHSGGVITSAPAFATNSVSEAFSNILQFEEFNGMGSEGREIFYRQMTIPHGGCSDCNQDESVVDEFKAEFEKADTDFQVCSDSLESAE